MAKYKTITFACVHMVVAFTVVGVMTGSWALGGLVALIEPAINTVAYFVHERVWELRAARSLGDGRSSNEPFGASSHWVRA